jgi:tRNA modification GTPase
MSFDTRDTIVAIATPPGRGGIGVVRVSGPDAHPIARALITHTADLEPRHATLTTVRLKPDTTYEVPASETSDAAPASKTSPADSRTPATTEVVSGFSRTSDDVRDHAIVTYFPAPASYTGDDVVELSAHGSPVVLRAIVAAAIDRGARAAEPGEFTLRAFLNGRIDLMQAEAVADLIDAATPLQARAAFDQLEGTLTRAIAGIDAGLFDLIARLEASVDFPDEGYHFVEPGAVARALDDLLAQTGALLAGARRGRLIREGLQVAIVGNPNVGKSSLFNALLGANRAIVTDRPGTTRDLVTEMLDLDGLRLTLVDTAGLREATDPAEIEGVERSRQAVAVADAIVHVIDDDNVPEPGGANRLIVRNKIDLSPASHARAVAGVIAVSARTGDGLSQLRERLGHVLDADAQRERADITNVRHVALVERAHAALQRARTASMSETGAMPEEFVLADLQDARAAFEEITGRRTSEQLLAHIFARFCVGK